METIKGGKSSGHTRKSFPTGHSTESPTGSSPMPCCAFLSPQRADCSHNPFHVPQSRRQCNNCHCTFCPGDGTHNLQSAEAGVVCFKSPCKPTGGSTQTPYPPSPNAGYTTSSWLGHFLLFSLLPLARPSQQTLVLGCARPLSLRSHSTSGPSELSRCLTVQHHPPKP